MPYDRQELEGMGWRFDYDEVNNRKLASQCYGNMHRYKAYKAGETELTAFSSDSRKAAEMTAICEVNRWLTRHDEVEKDNPGHSRLVIA